ncbi:hypothetical protein [Microvirga tunisiensis]|uniref:hypothetical protein n=1 Tax=Microvirga tunisiensis TaxID=2108360 RepID=UPI00129C4DF9|nr:hypothetical protein [Microvirga tunisiensis]
MPEVAPDPCGPLGQSAHVADDGAFEFVLAAGRRLAGHGLLQVGVQTLVRVQLGALGRQVEDLDLLLALGQRGIGARKQRIRARESNLPATLPISGRKSSSIIAGMPCTGGALPSAGGSNVSPDILCRLKQSLASSW